MPCAATSCANGLVLGCGSENPLPRCEPPPSRKCRIFVAPAVLAWDGSYLERRTVAENAEEAGLPSGPGELSDDLTKELGTGIVHVTTVFCRELHGDLCERLLI
jgi:hypothetical protein